MPDCSSRLSASFQGLSRPAAFAIALAAVLAGVAGPGGGAAAALGAAPEDARVTRPAPRGVDAGWWARVQGDIRRAEYHVTWQDTTALPDLPDGAWHAPNRAQGFRTYFTPRGVRVVPRVPSGAVPWEWALSFAWYGRGDLRCGAAAPAAGLHPRENRIEFRRGPVTEWFVNDERGLEHGFEIPAPPGGAGCSAVPRAARVGQSPTPTDGQSPTATEGQSPTPTEGQSPTPTAEEPDTRLRVALALSGTLTPVIAADGHAIDFRGAGGTVAIHYAQLVVRDARGRELPAWFEGFARAGERGIEVVVDDTDAAYPVSIDPLATTPAWVVYGGQAMAHYSFSLGTAGDVNGDGYSDIVVGAPDYDAGEPDAGRVYVYYGSPSGPSFAANWIEDGEQDDARFGAAVATAGDVNADGYADLLVGSPGYTSSIADEGYALVFHGSATGLSHDVARVLFDHDYVRAANFGASLAAAGDVNGDGFGDVVVSAVGGVPGQRVFGYYGSPTGLPSFPDWTVTGDQAGSSFGWVLSAAGDVDGDGYADVIVGADHYDAGEDDEGKVFVYHGSGVGLSPTPSWTAEGNEAAAFLGISAGTAGDVNGDGYSDVVVGALSLGPAQGAVLVYHGSDRGLSATYDWRVNSPGPGSTYFGWSSGTAGDVNGDGHADVIIGEHGHSGADLSCGAAYVYHGSAAGLGSHYAWRVEGDEFNATLGTDVAAAGDVNGDGYADVIVGSEWYANLLSEEGRAAVYLGSPAGLAASSGWSGEANQAAASYGFAVAGAGDVNADGYSDIAVGAYDYDNGQTNEGRVFVYHGSAAGPSSTANWTAEGNQASASFGFSVAGAGDVDGDGYGDLLVGAPRHDGSLTNQGRVTAYRGSSHGLSAAAAWSASGAQTGAEFGTAVAGAGDVNGDGYADVIVGAPLHDDGAKDTGRADVFHGSIAGLGSAAAWSSSTKQADAQLGNAVASAGDVDRDGYSDVVIGAQYYDAGSTDEGIVYVWRGSSGGLGGSVWSAEGNQAGARFGRSVASAGDVNGDGYADVLVGASHHDTGLADAGRASLYLGSPAGLSSSADWSVSGSEAGAQLGTAVCGSGDVNGDGFADVAIGAPLQDGLAADGGRVVVYHGSAAGLPASADWTTDGKQAGQSLGRAVSTAGDVNGDGYADLLVGSPGYDHGETDEGSALLFYGNGGRGLDLRPQQRGVTDARAVAHLGASDGPDGFRLAITARTPFGRGKVLLEREVKPLERRLDGLATEVAVEYQDTGAEGTRFSLLESDLLDEKPYHWRVRFRYASVTTPLAPASRWLSLPFGGWQEARLRTGDPAAAGRVPGDAGGPGSPLTVVRAGTRVTLTWDASCLPTDGDYGIYEGIAGDWYSHEMRYCSTEGATTKTLTPLSGQTYYLVVPRNGTREGSYGTDSLGRERPQGSPACLPQQVGACP